MAGVSRIEITYDLAVSTNDYLTFENITIADIATGSTSEYINSATIGSVAVPAAGAVPQEYSSLTAGDGSYTVSGLSWQNADGSAATLVNGHFKAGTVYKASIELASATGYKFPAAGLTPSVNAGTPGLGSVSGGSVEGNKLTFAVTFGATQALEVTAIAVKAQPAKLSYVEGETLNLAGLAVTLTYNDTSTEDVAADQLSGKGIIPNPLGGTTLTIADDNGKAVELSCNGYTAQTDALTVAAATHGISVDLTSLDFGSAVEGYAAPSARTVTVTNNGNSSVTLTQPTASAAYTVGTLSKTVLASAETATFTVQPQTSLSANTYAETITVTTDHSTSAGVTVTFTVQAATHDISVDFGSLDFGSAVEGYAAPLAQTVTVTNNGNSSVALTQPAASAAYTVGALSKTVLASAETATFTVQPQAGLSANTYAETITVTTDHSTSAGVNVTFTVISATHGISVDLPSLDFGSAVEGYAAPSAQTVTVTNNGNSSVTLTQPTASAAYTVGTLSKTVLASAETATFTVQPQAGLSANTYGETITVSTDYMTSANVSVTFTVQAAVYSITAEPFLKTFLSTPQGDDPPAEETITITNDGNKPVTLIQPAATNYTIGTLSKTALDPLETATFTVRPMEALAEGSYPETIHVQTTGAASAAVDVSFTVTAARTYAISADPAALAFDSLAEGYLPPAGKTVTVRNTGNQSVTLNQPAAAHYDLGVLTAALLAPGGSATFTVVPKTGLAEGAWNETIQITGSNGAGVQVDASFTCTHPIDYHILSGDGGTFQTGNAGSSGLTITSSGSLQNFIGLTLNGTPVDSGNYDVRSGSTIVTLHKDFLDTLAPGTYTLVFYYTDGYAQADFMVQDAMPPTGDDGISTLYATLMALSVMALLVFGRKRKTR